MFETIISILAIYLLYKIIKTALKLTWGATKIIAVILTVIAVPIFIICLIFVGGMLLLIPTALLAVAILILKILC